MFTKNMPSLVEDCNFNWYWNNWSKTEPRFMVSLSFLVSRHFLPWRCSCCSLPSWCSLALGRGQEGTLQRNLPMRSHARSIVSWGVMYPSTKELHHEKRVWLGIHAVYLDVLRNNPKIPKDTQRSIRNWGKNLNVFYDSSPGWSLGIRGSLRCGFGWRVPWLQQPVGWGSRMEDAWALW